jgi:hypothetical protein
MQDMERPRNLNQMRDGKVRLWIIVSMLILLAQSFQMLNEVEVAKANGVLHMRYQKSFVAVKTEVHKKLVQS